MAQLKSCLCKWGGPPGPRPAPWPASRVRQEIDSKRRAGPGGPARTWGSAPLHCKSTDHRRGFGGITATHGNVPFFLIGRRKTLLPDVTYSVCRLGPPKTTF